jgi:hypothetical protein
MPEVTVGQGATAPKHVQIINEQVHIDDLGDFDCKQVSIDQCSLVNDFKQPMLGMVTATACLGLGGLILWQYNLNEADPMAIMAHRSAWAPLFLIVIGLYLGYNAIRHRKHYLLKLHTENMGDVNCETSIDEMHELKHHVKIKCQC